MKIRILCVHLALMTACGSKDDGANDSGGTEADTDTDTDTDTDSCTTPPTTDTDTDTDTCTTPPTTDTDRERRTVRQRRAAFWAQHRVRRPKKRRLVASGRGARPS